MAKAPITKRTVDAAKPGTAEYVVWDDGGKETVKGFGLKVTPAGAKTYIFQYRVARAGMADKTAPKKFTIGRHGNLTPDQARARAKELAAMVDAGIDPRQAKLDAEAQKDRARREADEKARLENELEFEKVAERWLEEYELDHRASSVGQAKVSMRKYLIPKLKGRPMPRITKQELQAAFDAVPAGQRASRQQVFAYASILWRWAFERGDIEDNIVPSMLKPKGVKARDRVLVDAELARVWKAALTLREPFGAYFRLLMLTGQRRDEVASMNWSQLNRAEATWTKQSKDVKNEVAHMVPLVPAVIAELDALALAHQIRMASPKPDAAKWPKAGPVVSVKGTHALSCYSQAKEAIDEALALPCKGGAQVAPWRVHDLRRTLATGLQRLGVRFEVTEAVLNHVSGAKSGVAGIYQLHDWKDEKRDALSRWADHLAAITAED